MPALHEGDAFTGLSLFALTAVVPESDFESAYCLLREYPPAVLSVEFEGRDGLGARDGGCFCDAYRAAGVTRPKVYNRHGLECSIWTICLLFFWMLSFNTMHPCIMQ